ncbi:DUF3291 domain-containing protein [Streptomyces sennicomposti]
MPHLALYTFGSLKAPLADPAPLVREFHDSPGDVYGHIGRYPGYIAHAEPAEGEGGTHFDLGWGEWGEFTVPAWYDKGRTPETIALAATLSVWSDLRPAFGAVHTGPHRVALNRRHDWFERTEHPSHVCWWVADGVTPTWREGVSRLEHLHASGPAPYAFTFHHSFAPDGTPASSKAPG